MTSRGSLPLRLAPLAGFLALTLTAACGGGGMGRPGEGRTTPSPGSLAQGATSWSRSVTPFPVLNVEGEPYEHAFLGGFDVPRPQLIDIDADGDADLFIQERSNELTFLENVGTATAPRYVWRTDRFAGLDINEWYRFVDMDLDGDMDVLAEQPFSYIRYYRNVGTGADPRFELAADTLRTVDGEPLFSDRQNIPNATDIDCDGLTDLFVGRLTGTVTRYEAADGTLPVPRFRLVTERFEDIEIVANLMGSLHGANTMDFADHDGDGDKDLFWGDFFEAGLLLLENTGSCQNPAIRNTPVPFPPGDPVQTSGYNAPTVADLNGDGRPDMLLGVLGGAYNPTTSAIRNLYYLEHTTDGFEVRTRRFLAQIDLGSETVPALGDIDGDGDADLLVGAKISPEQPSTGLIHVFENVGAAARPSFRQREPLPITGSYHYAPVLGDLDGDGDLDLLVGTWNDGVFLYRNDGGEAGTRWTAVGEGPLVDLTRGSNTTPALGDLDGDGDLDLVIGEASGTLNYYRNAGTASSPRFELVSDEWLGIDIGRRSAPALVDLDGDGGLELVVGTEDGPVRVFRSTAGGSDFIEDERARPPRFPYAAPTFHDLDGDGRLEVVIGGLSGGLVHYTR